jgi:hypothetical protein
MINTDAILRVRRAFDQADGIAMLRIILSALDPIEPGVEARDKEVKAKVAAEKAAADKVAGKKKPRRPSCCAAFFLGLQAFNKVYAYSEIHFCSTAN